MNRYHLAITITMRSLFLAFLGLLSISTVCAQKPISCELMNHDEKKELALEILDQLSDDGILAVQIQDYGRQIEEIDRLLNLQDISDKTAKGLFKKRDDYVARKTERTETLKVAFAKEYDYSSVVFYYASDRDKFLNRDKSILFTAEGHALPSSFDYTRIALILQEGRTQNKSLEAFLVYQSDFSEVCAPMKSYYKMNRLSTFFSGGDKEAYKKAEKMVIDLKRSLSELHQVLSISH